MKERENNRGVTLVIYRSKIRK